MRNHLEISALLHFQNQDHYLQSQGDYVEERNMHKVKWLQQMGLRTSCFQSFSNLTSTCHNSPGILPSHQPQHFFQANHVCKPAVWYCNTKGPAVSQVHGTRVHVGKAWHNIWREDSLLWMMNFLISPSFNHQTASYIEIETVIISKGTLQSREQRFWNK